MERRSLATGVLSLSPWASLALAAMLTSALAAAEPAGGGFSWERQGPALPGQRQTDRPRYDETYPPLRSNQTTGSAVVAPKAPVVYAPGPPLPAVQPSTPAVQPASAGLIAAARQADLHVKRGT